MVGGEESVFEWGEDCGLLGRVAMADDGIRWVEMSDMMGRGETKREFDNT